MLALYVSFWDVGKTAYVLDPMECVFEYVNITKMKTRPVLPPRGGAGPTSQSICQDSTIYSLNIKDLRQSNSSISTMNTIKPTAPKWDIRYDKSSLPSDWFDQALVELDFGYAYIFVQPIHLKLWYDQIDSEIEFEKAFANDSDHAAFSQIVGRLNAIDELSEEFDIPIVFMREKTPGEITADEGRTDWARYIPRRDSA